MDTELGTTGAGRQPAGARPPRPGRPDRLPLRRSLARILGVALLWTTAGIHLDLYLTGYRTIPVIGWLFLLQVIAGLGLGLLILVTRDRLAAAAGAGFALATLGGYLLSVQFGLFGFREVDTTAGIVAGCVEVAAFAVLAWYAAVPLPAGQGGRHGRTGISGVPGLGRLAALSAPQAGLGARQAGLAAAVVSLVALALLGGALAGAQNRSTATPAAAGTTHSQGGLRTARIGGTTVLTNAAGRTLYWFAPDTATRSACYGSCAAYWPPVPGPLTAGPGVTGTLGTIRRTGGSLQETYDGHPLYTYIGDSGPGQAHGNNLNLNGGLWHEVVVSGASG